MPAACWACAIGLTRVGGKLPGQPAGSSDPLGSCFDCHVFGCSGHAERQTNSGKWYCYPTVTKALAVSAGVVPDDDTLSVAFGSFEDFGQQFPRLASEVAPHRQNWSDRLREQDAILGPEGDPSRDLTAAAAATLDLLSGREGTATAAARDIGLVDLETVIREAGK